MDIEIKARKLSELYQDFEDRTRGYREAAVCGVGCADCCINVGDVDAVALEGWLILGHMKGMDPERRSQLMKLIEANDREEEGSI